MLVERDFGKTKMKVGKLRCGDQTSPHDNNHVTMSASKYTSAISVILERHIPTDKQVQFAQ